MQGRLLLRFIFHKGSSPKGAADIREGHSQVSSSLWWGLPLPATAAAVTLSSVGFHGGAKAVFHPGFVGALPITLNISQPLSLLKQLVPNREEGRKCRQQSWHPRFVTLISDFVHRSGLQTLTFPHVSLDYFTLMLFFILSSSFEKNNSS